MNKTPIHAVYEELDSLLQQRKSLSGIDEKAFARIIFKLLLALGRAILQEVEDELDPNPKSV